MGGIQLTPQPPKLNENKKVIHILDKDIKNDEILELMFHDLWPRKPLIRIAIAMGMAKKHSIKNVDSWQIRSRIQLSEQQMEQQAEEMLEIAKELLPSKRTKN